MATIVFTVTQTRRLLLRLRSEKTFSALVAEAHKECELAKHDSCPLKKRLALLESERV